MDEESHSFRMDWRVAFGLVVTIIWISTGLVYLLSIVGWGNFVHLPTADIGSFLEGAFAPLAFLWLMGWHEAHSSEPCAGALLFTSP